MPSNLKTLAEAKVKALVGAVIAACVAYGSTALTTGNAITAHGFEAAAAGAVLAFLGIHQAPANKPKPTRKPVKPAK